MRRIFLVAIALVVAIAIVGCASSRDEQQAETAEAAAARSEQAAARAEQAAAQALDASAKAMEAADRATKAVQEATKEINRVADHLDQMERDREAATHGRRRSHVRSAGTSEGGSRRPKPEAAASATAVPTATTR